MSLFKKAIERLRRFGVISLVVGAIVSLMARYIRWSDNRFWLAKVSRFKEEDNIILTLDTHKMIVDREDTGLSRTLILEGVWEYYASQLIKKKVKEGDVLVDIGANIGYYAIMESKLVGETGRVFAIEPVPKCVALLKENVKLNNCGNVEVYELAIGEKKGLVQMNVSRRLNFSSISDVNTVCSGEDTKIVEQIDVNMVSLDELFQDKPAPNFIRMDVEGYEYQIINGMSNLLNSNKLTRMFIELHFRILGRDKSIELLSSLRENGFEITEAVSEIKESLFRHKILRKFIQLSRKTQKYPLKPFSIHKLKISDIINNERILNGEVSGLELFFEKV